MDPKMIIAIQGMDKEDLNNALKSLGKNDYDTIQALSLSMEQGMKDRSAHKRKVMFGYWSALELLAKLGIYMNENGVMK